MRLGQREIWCKPDRASRVMLFREVDDVDFRRYGGPYGDTYWLETDTDIVPLSGATWADWEGGDWEGADWEGGERLALVRDGKLIEGRWDGSALSESELFDGNRLTPIEVAPPDWAQRW
jgi:hypothetical protein